MSPLLVVSLVLLSMSACEAYTWGSRAVANNQYPYVVSIRRHFNFYHNCSGTLIAPAWVLTVRHCFDSMYVVPNHDYNVFDVRIGTRELKLNPQRGVAQIILHPGDEDVALVQLSSPVGWPHVPAPLQLGRFPQTPQTKCFTSSYGQSSRVYDMRPERINVWAHYLNTTVVNHHLCVRQYVKLEYIRPSQICLLTGDGRGECPGYSMGGPVICHGRVVGIMSRWLFGKHIQQPHHTSCARGTRQVIMATTIDSVYPWLSEFVDGMDVATISEGSENVYQNILLMGSVTFSLLCH